jgi:LDH2 family malate/lactate/ureidoglycolate dehydrogenase
VNHPHPEVGGHEIVDVAVDAARQALEAAFTDAGMLPAEAHRIVDALLDAELCEVPTHGFLRVPWYLQAIATGSVTVGRPPTTDRRAAGVAMVDGHGSYGYLPTWLAVDEAIAGAAASGIGLAGVRDVAEFGRAAYYATEAARRGHVAIVCQNTLPLLAAPGSDRVTHGNNPLAYSAPGAAAPVFDAAFTARSGGELRRRAVLGLPLPPAWGYVDADGVPTTDAHVAAASVQQAVGGAKGFGMAVLVDLLAGMLTGAASSVDVTPGAPVVGAMVIAIDPLACGTTVEAIEAACATSAGAVRESGGRWPGDRARAARELGSARGTVRVPRPIFDAACAAAGDRLRRAAA